MTKTNGELAELLEDVFHGQYDNHLEEIIDVINDRKKAYSRVSISSLENGDKVMIQNIRPKYLSGCTADFVKVEKGKAVIIIDDTFKARRYAGQEVTVGFTSVKADF